VRRVLRLALEPLQLLEEGLELLLCQDGVGQEVRRVAVLPLVFVYPIFHVAAFLDQGSVSRYSALTGSRNRRKRQRELAHQKLGEKPHALACKRPSLPPRTGCSWAGPGG